MNKKTHRPMCFASKLLILLKGPGGYLWFITFCFLAGIIASDMRSAWVEYMIFPSAQLVETKATVMWSDDTNMEINEQTVSQVHYRYELMGIDFEAVSYGREWYPNKGRVVTVEYVAGEPYISRIKGQDYSKGASVVMVFFVNCLILMVIALFRTKIALRWIKFLINGVPTQAKYLKKEATMTSINNQTVYKLFYEYTDNHQQQRQAMVKTHEIEKLTNEDYKNILFLPNKSDLFLLVDQVNIDLKINNDGGWKCDFWALIKAFVAKFTIPIAIYLLFSLF
ncbi:MAG: hypothetical protein HN826_11235, partial [Methylococcales bacterium]|nr:hypothetical protein [Methylococcales bacterium]